MCNYFQNFMNETSIIICHTLDRIFKTRDDIICRTTNVVYIVYCTLEGHQGVGSTLCWKPHPSNYQSHV